MWSNTFNIFITFALTNWTIGPSSETTWFPTWIKGTLPVNGKKCAKAFQYIKVYVKKLTQNSEVFINRRVPENYNL